MEVLRTKIQVPGLRHELVPRSAIIQALSNTNAYRLALVAAPAGYGKTTAVVQGVQAANLPAAWLTVDALDNDPVRFWGHLVAALDSVLPSPAPLLTQMQTEAEVDAEQAFLTRLTNVLADHDQAFLLVLDNYHTITNTIVDHDVAFLAEHMPQSMRLIIASRSVPAFLRQGHRSTTGPVYHCDAQCLAFSPEEATEYYHLMGLRLSPREWTEFVAYSEGWVTGLQVLGRTLPARFGVPSPQNTDIPDLFDYFDQEVFGHLETSDQAFVLKTSILTTLSGALCQAVTGTNDGHQRLVELAATNAFTQRLNSEGWYRYHGMFADFLSQKRVLERKWRFDTGSLHVRAGDWFANNGHWEQAFQHYKNADDYRKVAELVENHGRVMLDTGHSSLLRKCLCYVPRDIIRASDFLNLTRAWVLLVAGRVDSARRAVEVIQRRGLASESQKADYAWLRAVIHLHQGEFDVAARLAQEAATQRVPSKLFGTGVSLNPGCDTLLAGLFGHHGRLTTTEQCCHDLFLHLKGVPPLNSGYTPTLLGEVLYEENHLDRAHSSLVDGLNEAIRHQSPGSLVPAVRGLSRLRWASGDWAGAFDVLNDGQRWLSDMGQPHWARVLDAWWVRLSICTGNSENIARWMKTRQPQIPGIFREAELQNYIALARVFLARRQYYQCETVLSGVLVLVERCDRINYLIEVLNLLAILHYQMGDRERADRTLRQALDLGSQEGYRRAFIDEGAPMLPLLSLVTRASDDRAGATKLRSYAEGLLADTVQFVSLQEKHGRNRESPASGSPPKPFLTRREEEVLGLMSTGATNTEIARSLDVAVPTVKFHVGRIYSKLGTRKRLQAVQLARELGLVT